MINRVGALLIVCFFGLNLYSQDLTNKKALEIPQQLILPEKTLLLKKIEGFKPLPGNTWEVYSDRTINKTFTKPGGGKVFKSLQYLDRYYVMEVKKKYLHIIKDSDLNSDRSFSAKAEDYGWVASDKMLLWSHCLVDGNKNSVRLFMFKTANTSFYFDGNISNKKNNSNYFQVVYLFKEDNDRLLLGKSVRLSEDKELINESIIGWVNKDLVNYFSTNTFAEPCNEIIFDGQLPKNIFNPVFLNKRNLIKAFTKRKFDITKVLYKRNNIKDKIPANIFRFPIVLLNDSIASVLCFYPDKNLMPGEFNALLENKNSFYEGYCNMSSVGNELSYKMVMLLSKSQLSQLLIDLTFLENVLSNESSLEDAQNKIYKHFDIIDQEDYVNNVSILSIFKKKFNVLPTHLVELPTLNTYYSDDGLKQSLIKKLKENIKELNMIYNDDSSNRMFISNRNPFFWIPCSLLP